MPSYGSMLSQRQWNLQCSFPQYFITGQELTYKKHVVMEFGHVQTHEEHTKDMNQCTMGVICLGPTGNLLGGHWFTFLTLGVHGVRHQCTEIPMTFT